MRRGSALQSSSFLLVSYMPLAKINAALCGFCRLRQPSPASRASKVPKRVLAATLGAHEHRLRAPRRAA